jgi:hypothetical protein
MPAIVDAQPLRSKSRLTGELALAPEPSRKFADVIADKGVTETVVDSA